jgi:predicted SAM-dependent methyltransferase
MKLHLGCGKKYIKGFKHVDLLDYSHIDYRVSVDNLSFAKDNSVELIYASHVLEHFGRDEYEKVLDEWYRVLKIDGILRIAVPDFKSIVNYYNKTADMESLLGLVVGGQKFGEYDYHKMIFDEGFLKNKLKDVGFKSISKYEWRNVSHANVDDFSQAYLPHMDKKNGMLMSLNMEATK